MSLIEGYSVFPRMFTGKAIGVARCCVEVSALCLVHVVISSLLFSESSQVSCLMATTLTKIFSVEVNPENERAPSISFFFLS